MTSQQVRLTPTGAWVLDAAWRGQVVLLTDDLIVALRRPAPLGGFEWLDVSKPFLDLRRAGWAYIEPPDPLQPTPRMLPALVTPAGEEALMEYQAAQRKRQQAKGGKR